MILNPEEKLIFLSSQINLNAQELKSLNDLIQEINDWSAYQRLLALVGSAPLAYKNFQLVNERGTIPRQILTMLKERYSKVFFASSRKYFDFEPVVHTLNQHGIDFVPLKGIYLALLLYKDIGLRPMSDIDILVRPKDLERSRQALLDLGWNYRPENKKSKFITQKLNWQHPYSFVLGSTTLELHDKFHSGLTSYKFNMDECWDRVITINFLKGHAFRLNDIDLLLHLSTHLCRHLENNKFNLKSISDIVALLKNLQDELDWKQLIARCKKYNCLSEVREIFLICRKFFAVHINEDFIKDSEVISKTNYELLFLNTFRNTKSKSGHKAVLTKNKNLNQLKGVNGIGNKFLFLLHDIFPASDFMIRHYNIKKRNLVYFYYPVRISHAIASILKNW